jgi:hypothetical protein
LRHGRVAIQDGIFFALLDAGAKQGPNPREVGPAGTEEADDCIPKRRNRDLMNWRDIAKNARWQKNALVMLLFDGLSHRNDAYNSFSILRFRSQMR